MAACQAQYVFPSSAVISPGTSLLVFVVMSIIETPLASRYDATKQAGAHGASCLSVAIQKNNCTARE
jgi:hypothetical protein